uniref:Thymidylate synthase n=1 Tax=Megaviridae environmental sample TaxID=1737588 RepID=A0A5J6VIZ5_9VIRU|nr:MAG: thymidylate synthase [Megaviridae environmental sample]
MFSLVAGVTLHNNKLGIACNNRIPWYIPNDLKSFRRITMDGIVIMGRKTYFDIPEKNRPLFGRLNVVVSRNPNVRKLGIPDNVLVYNSFDKALCDMMAIGKVYVIGGADIYNQAIQYKECHTLHLNFISMRSNEEIPCDCYFPNIGDFKLMKNTEIPCEGEYILKECTFERCTYSIDSNLKKPPNTLPNTPHPEYQYLKAIRDIIDNGVTRRDRTGEGTKSKFGLTMRWSLENKVFPLLTTKKVFWRGVLEELLWFVRGDTNERTLADKKVHIWKDNASREFLDSIGLINREEGDLGPVYGFQWRHFGANYVNCHSKYAGEGVDQLIQCIDQIKKNPTSRRIILSAWNPKDLPQMALPPCHMMCQFYVSEGMLSCQMYQRSADMGLGVPFNIASYACLTRMIAQVCNLKAGEFIHVIGDAHVYLNHIDALEKQLERTPKPLPHLEINPNVKNIDEFQVDDFEVIKYDCYPSIPMKMAV